MNRLRTPLFAATACIMFATVLIADSITESQSNTTSTWQDGKYQLWDYGNSHGWLDTPSPNAGDGYNYGYWVLPFNLSGMPRGSSVTYAAIDASWIIEEPIIYPAVVD